jgi:hypothetical protein
MTDFSPLKTANFSPLATIGLGTAAAMVARTVMGVKGVVDKLHCSGLEERLLVGEKEKILWILDGSNSSS